ncbi:MAG: hypothetical protein V3S98_06595 [Dehalococcoidia bacterium]
MPSRQRTTQADSVADRTWTSSVVLSAAIVAIATLASALINPLLDRVVHWNIVAVLMPSLFVIFVLLFKKRWV